VQGITVLMFYIRRSRAYDMFILDRHLGNAKYLNGEGDFPDPSSYGR